MEQILSTILIAVSLSLDAFAVSVSSGISIPGFSARHGIKMGCYFGFFQFAMPMIGWLLGTSVSTYIEAVDHWIAFGLLFIIGGKMAWEALRKDCDAGETPVTELTVRRLTVLAVATSIDALAVGVSMAFMEVNILASSLTIGVVTFALSVAGGLVGKRLGCLFQKRAELVGGVVLMLIGAKILAEHLL